MRKWIRYDAELLIFAGLIIALDQVTKAMLRARLAPGESYAPWDWAASFLTLVHTSNTGAAFSFAQGWGPLFMALAIAASVGIIYYYPRLPSRDLLLRAGLILVLSGAVGNLIDRFTQGGQVTDFIAVRYFAIFNVADASITCGAAALFLWTWLHRHEEN